MCILEKLVEMRNVLCEKDEMERDRKVKGLEPYRTQFSHLLEFEAVRIIHITYTSPYKMRLSIYLSLLCFDLHFEIAHIRVRLSS